ncbi:MAG: choice-of-anchor R domain-containing protein [Caulobacteraceae bacterium]
MKFGLVLGALGALVVTVSAGAATLYDNIGATPYDAEAIEAYGPLAASFSTSSATTLTGVEVLLYLPEDPAATTTVDLLADNSTSPGTLIATLGTIDDSMLNGGDNPVSLATDQALAADTRYWIELTSNDDAISWDYAANPSGPGVAGEYWSDNRGVTQNGYDDNGPFQMDLTAGAAGVPEPATWALMVLGFGALGWALRRRGTGLAAA